MSNSLSYTSLQLDADNQQLWCNGELVKLLPKAFAVLDYLVAHPHQLVTKEDLLTAVWPDTVVSDWVLTTSIREIRRALGDTPQAPQYIETVHRKGYRFIAALGRQRAESILPPGLPRDVGQQTTPLVGRETELQQLQAWLERALAGERQVVFVTGEAGIGKTSLVRTFLEQIAADQRVWVGRGQCIQQYGEGEAYLPVLEALGRLGQKQESQRLVESLQQYAPTWLAHLPALVQPERIQETEWQGQGATPPRMLREIAQALEALTTEQGLVLWLEDLQWSDFCTLHFLAYLARRPDPARLLIIGTYRPVDVIAQEHPLRALKQELLLHRQCQELPMELLTTAAVTQYLQGRFAQSPVATQLGPLIHQWTEGNPLFVVNLVDYVEEKVANNLEQDLATVDMHTLREQLGVPDDLRQMIEIQFESLLGHEQQILEAASVAGADFTAAEVAVVLRRDPSEVEEHCDHLLRHSHFLMQQGTAEWPDGTVSAQYTFQHVLYQAVLYERLPPGQRRGFHQHIGLRLETAYGGQAREKAATLAVHFEHGRDYERAISYRQQAMHNALRRSAYEEALLHCTRGQELLQLLPVTQTHLSHELSFLLNQARAHEAMQGMATPELTPIYDRVSQLCQQIDDAEQRGTALLGVSRWHFNDGHLHPASDTAEDVLNVAQDLNNPALLRDAYANLALAEFFGTKATLAHHHFTQSLAVPFPNDHLSLPPTAYDIGLLCLSFSAYSLWLLGYADQARTHSEHLLAEIQHFPSTASRALALTLTTRLFQELRQLNAVQEYAETLNSFATEQGLPYWQSSSQIDRGWALAMQGHQQVGISELQKGLAELRRGGPKITFTRSLALLAEIYVRTGQLEDGLQAVGEALAGRENNEPWFYDAELYRLKGEYLHQQAQHKWRKAHVLAEAEACFQHSLDLARVQEAKSFELRSATNLSRLWQQQGKTSQARQLLAEIYHWFTEGFDTADLQEAKALLDELEKA